MINQLKLILKQKIDSNLEMALNTVIQIILYDPLHNLSLISRMPKQGEVVKSNSEFSLRSLLIPLAADQPAPA